MIEFYVGFRRFPYTNDEMRIYEFRGRTKKLVEKTSRSGETRVVPHEGKNFPVLVAATNLDCALAYLKELRPGFQPNHVNCCGVFYLQHRFPFGQKIRTR